MKRIITCILALVAVFALCSCEKEQTVSVNGFLITLENRCEQNIYGVNMKITVGDKEINKFVANGDREKISDEQIEFEITEEDLGGEQYGEVECYITVLSEKNSYRECNKTLKIDYELGQTYSYVLSGNHSIGFYLAKKSS